MKSGVMTLSVVSPRRRSMSAPRERNGLKELTACEGVTSTTMLFGGAPRCAKAAAGESKTIAPQRLRFVENMLLLRLACRPAGPAGKRVLHRLKPVLPGNISVPLAVVDSRSPAGQSRGGLSRGCHPSG